MEINYLTPEDLTFFLLKKKYLVIFYKELFVNWWVLFLEQIMRNSSSTKTTLNRIEKWQKFTNLFPFHGTWFLKSFRILKIGITSLNFSFSLPLLVLMHTNVQQFLNQPLGRTRISRNEILVFSFGILSRILIFKSKN